MFIALWCGVLHQPNVNLEIIFRIISSSIFWDAKYFRICVSVCMYFNVRLNLFAQRAPQKCCAMSCFSFPIAYYHQTFLARAHGLIFIRLYVVFVSWSNSHNTYLKQPSPPTSDIFTQFQIYCCTHTHTHNKAYIKNYCYLHTTLPYSFHYFMATQLCIIFALLFSLIAAVFSFLILHSSRYRNFVEYIVKQ